MSHSKFLSKSQRERAKNGQIKLYHLLIFFIITDNIFIHTGICTVDTSSNPHYLPSFFMILTLPGLLVLIEISVM